MKYIIVLIMIGICGSAFAEDKCSDAVTTGTVAEKIELKTDVPKYMEGATITVTLRDGKTSTVPAEKFKVVPRKQQFIVTKVSIDTVTTCHTSDKNRVSVLTGRGPKSSLKRSKSGNAEQVENEYGTTVGLQYQRSLDVKVFDMPLSVGGQIQDNSSGMAIIGLDF